MTTLHESHSRFGPKRRQPRIGVVLAALAMAVAPTVASSGSSPATASTDASAAAPASDVITLSMEVRPGDPVPLGLVRYKAASEFDDVGYAGKGIDIALIDSGVSLVPGLDQPGKVLFGPDLSEEAADERLRNVDTYGHGTHMAGILAGNDGKDVLGIAPDSRIVSVKVAGASGETRLEQVIAAIDWVVEHRNDNGMNIRVLNLSLGAPGVKTNVGDPLSAAVERAWHAGIVVVAAAGNRGNDAGGIDTPAVSPFVMAVGAIESYDAWGSADSLPSWTSGGNEFRTADVVAPGASIMSFRVPGSTLDRRHPEAVVGDRYFKGSGTSQSAAVVSGYVANLLSLQPRMTPDQVKFIFEREADDMDRHGLLDGSGKIDPRDSARHRSAAERAPEQRYTPAVAGLGLKDIDASGASWSGGEWSGASWSGGVWSGASWSGASWSGASWSGASWSGGVWSGASWSGASWSGASWSGIAWHGEGWK